MFAAGSQGNRFCLLKHMEFKHYIEIFLKTFVKKLEWIWGIKLYYIYQLFPAVNIDNKWQREQIFKCKRGIDYIFVFFLGKQNVSWAVPHLLDSILKLERLWHLSFLDVICFIPIKNFQLHEIPGFKRRNI